MSSGKAALMARGKRIKPLDLSSTIKEIFDKYGEDVYEVLGKAVDDVSEEAVQKLHAGGSYGGTGAYNRDWVADDVPKGRFSKSKVIHNADHYRLAHLLEKGHVIRNGTQRTFGNTKAYPHIQPVEEWTKSELPKKVEEAITHIS